MKASTFYRIAADRMKKVRPVVARNARELAKALGLTPVDGMEIEFRSELNDKIIEVVSKKRLDAHQTPANLCQAVNKLGQASRKETSEHARRHSA